MRRGQMLLWILPLLLILSACSLGNSAPGAPSDGSSVDQSGQSATPETQIPTPFSGQPAVVVRQVLPLLQKAAGEPTAPGPPPPSAGLTLYVDPHLPQGVSSALALPDWLSVSPNAQEASLLLSSGSDAAVGRWIYALVAPFPSIPSEVSATDLKRAWQAKGGGPFSDAPLLMDEDTYRLWAQVWGEAEPGGVEIIKTEKLLDEAWSRGTAWAIIPFEALEPRWKVLAVDGQAPVRVDFDPADYALSLPLTVSGEGQLPDLARRELGLDTDQPLITGTNRDPGRLTTVVLTGVTALVRATAFTMEQRGVTYPAQDIRDILRSADILHISNEVPFARDCPFPDPVQEGLKFCSSPDYMGLLEDIGTDVVELTGDHFADWGRDAMDYTLDLYEKHDWPVYGGGRDLAAGKAPLTLEHNGNKIAFIGCNAKGGPFAQAGPSNPGAVPCDFDYMHTQIEKLRDQGYNVIATFQHFEYYTYQAQPNQVADSEGMARAGAVIVSGSQAHQPQAMEFFKDSFIHYGLGNLFFDQYDISPATRQAFIDRHVFYDGRYISTELIPIIFVDYARARPMKTDEAAELLNSVFLASGW
jgi:hypothetical protein